MSAHYFAFSTNWKAGHRLCAECGRTYGLGDHILVDNLESYTSYVCPTGGGHGHSSIWTGNRASHPELNRPGDDTCICGEKFVREDDEQWTVSWEMRGPWTDEWTPVSRTGSRHSVVGQHSGLLSLVAAGELIRNVELRQGA